MIEITKNEAEAIRKKYGAETSITVTSRGKGSTRKHRYVEESGRILFFLERFRKKQAR